MRQPRFWALCIFRHAPKFKSICWWYIPFVAPLNHYPPYVHTIIYAYSIELYIYTYCSIYAYIYINTYNYIYIYTYIPPFEVTPLLPPSRPVQRPQQQGRQGQRQRRAQRQLQLLRLAGRRSDGRSKDAEQAQLWTGQEGPTAEPRRTPQLLKMAIEIVDLPMKHGDVP